MQGQRKKITTKARQLLNSADLLISPIVPLELEIMFELGRTKLPWRDVEAKLTAELSLQVCKLSFVQVSYVARDEKWTRDPFDRIIVAQAKANGFAFLLSADEEIAKNYPRTVW